MNIDIKKYQQQKTVPSAPPVESGSLMDLLNKDISLFGKQLPLKKKEAFYTELSTLLKAGLDLKTALELVEESQVKAKEKKLFADLQELIIKGSTLSQAMQDVDQFTAYEVYSIQIAEESGQLYPVLDQLGSYFTKNIQYRRLLVSALSYPVLVVSVAIIALVFLLQFLVPLFGDIYARLDQTLPPLTVLIISLSNIVQKYIGVTCLSIAVLVAALFTQRKKDWFRKIAAIIMVRMPIFGSLIKQLYLARFAHAMGFLLHAKVPVLRALDLVQKMVSFYPIEDSLTTVKKEILQGKALHKCLSPYRIYPRRMIALIKVGEEANQLDNMFDKLSAQYNDEVEQQTKMIGSLIEPVLIVFLAVVVGLVLVSMYMPIFKLVTTMG